MTSPSPFLALPGELRNKIYTEVAHNAPSIKLFEGRVVLPPLAGVCRQIRKEMSGKYQAELYLDPAAPIHAHITNFNFHPLLRWLNAHRQDLKGEAPRLLVITSVLLTPDFATGIFDPDSANETNNRKRAARAYSNSLDTLVRNLVYFGPYFEAWDRCDVPDQAVNAWGDELPGYSPVYIVPPCPIMRGGVVTVEIAGTRFGLRCKARTIHRHHPVSPEGPIGSEDRGFCYRGDHCHHFLKRLRSRPRAHFGHALCLEGFIRTEMKISHNASTHKKWRRECLVQSTPHEQELAGIYRRLDKTNIDIGVFENMARRDFPGRHPSANEMIGEKRVHDFINPSPLFEDDLVDLLTHPPKRLAVGDAWYECHRVLGYRLKRNFDWSEEEEQRWLFDIELRWVIGKMECLDLGVFPMGPVSR